MKTYIHARLGKDDCEILAGLKAATGESDSRLVRRGLRLVWKELSGSPSALDAAGDSVAKFKKGPKDLSTNRRYLARFGR